MNDNERMLLRAVVDNDPKKSPCVCQTYLE